MTIELIRKSNLECWLWGELHINDIKFCDTLELGDFNQIQVGSYSMKLLWNKNHTLKFCAIFNVLNQFNSVFVFNNNFLFHGIEIRQNNNFITVGVKATECYLKNQNHYFNVLVNFVEDCEEKNENVELIVKNYMESTKNE